MFSFTRVHTHTYELPTEKQHNLQHRPAALAGRVRAGCGTLAEPPPSQHRGRAVAQGGPRTAQAGPGQGRSKQLVTIHTHNARQGPDPTACVPTI